jgi:hypothetical protein
LAAVADRRNVECLAVLDSHVLGQILYVPHAPHVVLKSLCKSAR